MRQRLRRRLASLTLLDIAAGAAVSAIPLAAANAQPLPSFNWSGFYWGAHAGYRTADANFTAGAYTFASGFGPMSYPARNDRFDFDGFIGGPHVGYNWQFNPNWLFGFEADWDWGKSKKGVTATHTNNPTVADGFTTRRSDLTLEWQATIRARTGVIVQSVLWYVTSGVAFAHIKWTDSTSLVGDDAGEAASTSFNVSKTLTGFVVGAGLEQMFAPNWTWRVEYLYENFGNVSLPHGFGQTGNLDLEHIHKVRFGISFKTP
jgi:outer membrane immunogenic protein